jgi:hypothetical protein
MARSLSDPPMNLFRTIAPAWKHSDPVRRKMTKNLLDLTAVQLHVKARQKVPACGVERAKPRMGVAVSGPEVRKLGGVALEARAGLFELPVTS